MQVVGSSRGIEHVLISEQSRQTAKEASLQYVSNSRVGINRKRRGKKFQYLLKGKLITDEITLLRIKKLAIPPAWTNVWVCQSSTGHIQATGFDTKKRKQYRYHTQWNTYRNQTKFHKLYEFGKALPALRKCIEHDIINSNLTKEKVLATVVSLMERTFIRIGNSEYEKLYGSYGLTTLKDNHVRVNGQELKFSFKGKKGIYHSIMLKSKRLAKIVKACRDIPGKELFQYLNEDGTASTIDSGMVNNYIKEATGKDFSAKDFRTWAGSLSILSSFKAQKEALTENEIKKNIICALEEVSAKLGNTRSVCKKYYVHPEIISLYEQNGLQKYLKHLDEIEKCDDITDLTQEEKILMKLLRKF